MKLVVTHLKDGENLFHFDSLKESWLREVVASIARRGYEFKSPMQVDLSLTKLEPDYYLKGKMSFGVSQPCARCGEPFDMPILHSFDVALAHVSRAKVTPKLTEESDELDINFFEGPEIDLMPIMEEQFFLSIPYQSLCEEHCKGVCQQCGQNMNRNPCNCAVPNAINPFTILKQLKT